MNMIDCVIHSCSVRDNGNSDGGMQIVSSNVVVLRSTIVGNEAQRVGGGLFTAIPVNRQTSM